MRPPQEKSSRARSGNGGG